MFDLIHWISSAMLFLGFVIFAIEIVLVIHYYPYDKKIFYEPENRFVSWLYGHSPLLVFVAIILILLGSAEFMLIM